MNRIKDYILWLEENQPDPTQEEHNEAHARLWNLRHPATKPCLAPLDEVEGFFEELYERLEAAAAHVS